MLETLAWLLPGVCMFIGWLAGAAQQRRYDRRKNAAMASCAGCDWTSGPVPLGEAFKLAEDHRAMPHPAGFTRTLVERAV